MDSFTEPVVRQHAPHRASQTRAAKGVPGQNLKSLFKIIDIMECFSTVEAELSVSEIARRTNLSKSTAHRILDSLRAVGLLEQEGSRDRYHLGLKLFELGSTALANMRLHREARPFVESLSKLSGEAVHLVCPTAPICCW